MILNADALHIPLADGTVQTCVTSPPYYGLRDYGVAGQIGLEETPEEYIEKIVKVFREVRRVLRDDGTCWVNMGDCYATTPNGRSAQDTKEAGNDDRTFRDKPMSTVGVFGCKPKDLIGMPWMVAFALRADGWYLRSEIIWHKPNPMPESVRDRPTKAHEQIFLLSKSPRYYYDADAIAEPSIQGDETIRDRTGDKVNNTPGRTPNGALLRNDYPTRNKRSVWTVTTKPYPEAHFATYPPDLIEPCILAGTSEKGQCPKCGAPWERVTEKGDLISSDGTSDDYKPKKNTEDAKIKARSEGWTPNHYYEKITTGWQPTCDCNAGEPVPQIVIDPFGGSGTTGEVAARYRRKFVLLDISMDYIELQRKRTTTDVMLPVFVGV